ncbi:MAG: PIG-L deacetylase family protein [Pirellulaceae bacterium]
MGESPDEAEKSVLAIAAHPDDIEFVMAGTLLRLAERGWQVHYFNIANGCLGSEIFSREECAKVRLGEAQAAAAALPAIFYPPICDDLEILYSKELLAQVAAVVRQARPSIVLTHSLVDYMEDHQYAARLAVSATFARGAPNFVTQPDVGSFNQDVAIYHAQPHGNREPMGQFVAPERIVDVTDLQTRKRELLLCHASQAAWLDASQGLQSYVETMDALNAEVGSLTEGFIRAEGWRKHAHIGFSGTGFDPLGGALEDVSVWNPAYTKQVAERPVGNSVVRSSVR